MKKAQRLEEVTGAVTVWDDEGGCLLFVKSKDGKWKEGVEGINCETDGLHYVINLNGKRTLISVDDRCCAREGDTDGFEEVRE